MEDKDYLFTFRVNPVKDKFIYDKIAKLKGDRSEHIKKALYVYFGRGYYQDEETQREFESFRAVDALNM